MKGYFKNIKVDCGKIRKNGVVRGRFNIIGGYNVRDVSGGCSCGGRPNVNWKFSDGVLDVWTTAAIINGNRDVTRPIIVTMGDKVKQILWIKYYVI